MDVIEQIRARLGELSVAERKVGQVVIADPRGFAQMPVELLAARAGVSQPTVVRFCRRLGFAGLRDFKLRLGVRPVEGVPFVHRAVQEDDSTSQLIAKVLDNAVAAMLGLRDQALEAPYERAIEVLHRTIRGAGRAEFWGVGNSGIVAQDAQHKFFRLGAHAVAYADGHLQLMAATMLGRDDCAVLISNSGRSRDVIEAAELARRKGATTIGITASASPLARGVDILLAADHPENHERYSPMVSRLLHLSILDVIATGVALRLGPRLRPVLAEVKRQLRRRYLPN
jgi:RpiR family carbohydrate utilization transcriptional regulator